MYSLQLTMENELLQSQLELLKCKQDKDLAMWQQLVC